VVDLARQLKVTRGRKLRVDSTVVETNIRYPVDSTLLGDGVRVLNRTIQRAKRVVQHVTNMKQVFRNRSRSVQRVMRQLIETARRRGEQAEQSMQTQYQQLVALTETVVAQARQVTTTLHAQASTPARRLRHILEQFIPRVEQVVDQTRRRVFAGEAVPATEKLVSVFEPHTAIIRKGKLGSPVEFGRVLWLDEVDGGIVSRYAVLPGNPNDADQLQPSLDHHLHAFGQAPRVVAGDRKVHSTTGERYAQQLGIKHVVLPKPGKCSPERQHYERQSWFRRGRHWRVGIEGRISVLKRRHRLRRCLYHGPDGMERWVGWGILAHNLRQIAQAMA
jgi:IS5 family transposase